MRTRSTSGVKNNIKVQKYVNYNPRSNPGVKYYDAIPELILRCNTGVKNEHDECSSCSFDGYVVTNLFLVKCLKIFEILNIRNGLCRAVGTKYPRMTEG